MICRAIAPAIVGGTRIASRRGLSSVRALTPAVGATLSLEDLGLSLSSPEDHSAAAEAVHRVVMDHGVCFLRRGDNNNNNVEDDEDDKALVSFARRLGELEKPHPIYSPDPTSPLAVVAHDAEHPPDGAEWHTDCSWSEAPPFASVLWPRLLPATGGGDTLWLSTSAAFESLPQGMQSDLRSLEAVHDMGSFRNAYAANGGGAAGIAEGHARFGSAIYPVVRAHPVTGRECLFVNESFTASVVGLMADESRRLLSYLFDHMQRPDYQCRWRWQLGDVAIWDNRSTQHYACADYAGYSRRMHRVTVLDDRIGGT
ncbi:hypothetical protein TrST_g4327 [Triparma strigata]|uniref:TauD/TfdA-like domain-containing protein n=1 Tax=Triparma strigata TaxID=1606541 RepID=A0A9W7ASL6_9STRA|nr:hypothetical protein TrST_g4327 [Triparma strigata]